MQTSRHFSLSTEEELTLFGTATIAVLGGNCCRASSSFLASPTRSLFPTGYPLSREFDFQRCDRLSWRLEFPQTSLPSSSFYHHRCPFIAQLLWGVLLGDAGREGTLVILHKLQYSNSTGWLDKSSNERSTCPFAPFPLHGPR